MHSWRWNRSTGGDIPLRKKTRMIGSSGFWWLIILLCRKWIAPNFRAILRAPEVCRARLIIVHIPSCTNNAPPLPFTFLLS